MPNRFTRVPDRPVPALPAWVRVVVPIADVFMLLMVSRPRTGSLRRTWVTPATLQMCVLLVVACAVCAAVIASRVVHGSKLAMGIGVVLAVFAVGGGSVALVGWAQRRR